MKAILMALLGISTLFPINEVTAKIVHHARVIDVTIIGWVLTTTSDPEDGTITKVEVYNASQQLVLRQSCSGYSCNVDISGLASGTYTAKVTCQYNTYTEQFTL